MYVCDVCASEENALHRRFIDEEGDFLTTDSAFFATIGKYVWMNPPYSKPKPFIQRAIFNSKYNGIGCVILLNHDMSTSWARLLQTLFITHEVFDARISFLGADGKPVRGNKKGQFISIIPPFVGDGVPVVRYVSLEEVMNKAEVV